MQEQAKEKVKPEQAYILSVCHTQFKSKVIDKLASITCYAILYVEKQILTPTETLDRFDEGLIKARENL
jgi:hypothetical protein